MLGDKKFLRQLKVTHPRPPPPLVWLGPGDWTFFLVLLAIIATSFVCVLWFIETFLHNGHSLGPQHMLVQEGRCYRAVRPIDHGSNRGGILIQARRSVNPEELNIHIPNLEYKDIQIHSGDNTISIFTIYMPPSLNYIFQRCPWIAVVINQSKWYDSHPRRFQSIFLGIHSRISHAKIQLPTTTLWP